MCADLKLINSLFSITQEWVNQCPEEHWHRAAPEQLNKLDGHCMLVHKLAFHALVRIFNDHNSNQLYFARQQVPIPLRVTGDPAASVANGVKQWQPGTYISASIRQINAGKIVGATSCLLELLSNNAELLEKNVDQDSLLKFLELIEDKGPKPQVAFCVMLPGGVHFSPDYSTFCSVMCAVFVFSIWRSSRPFAAAKVYLLYRIRSTFCARFGCE
jgi:hypothetical protein